MKYLLQELRETFLPSRKPDSRLVLVDSISSASELAFMLSGEWDNCNGVVLSKYDLAAICSAADLIGAKWCCCGDKVAWLPKVAEKTLLERYKAGERYFINANLRCSVLSGQCLKGAILSHTFFCQADLAETNLENADLSLADISNANLTKANLTNANLFRTNLTGANLSGANLSGANLQKACLKGANLIGANLNGAQLSEADLRGASLE